MVTRFERSLTANEVRAAFCGAEFYCWSLNSANQFWTTRIAGRLPDSLFNRSNRTNFCPSPETSYRPSRTVLVASKSGSSNSSSGGPAGRGDLGRARERSLSPLEQWHQLEES